MTRACGLALACVLFALVPATGAGAKGGVLPPGRPCPPATAAPPVPGPVPPGEPAPGQVLACVADAAITGAPYAHWLAVADHVEAAKPRLTATERREEVMNFLISSGWVLGEAAALHVTPSTRAVKHQFDRIRAQQFPKRREFAAFLRDSGQSTADILYRVGLNLASQAIQRRVEGRAHGTAAGLRAFARFLPAFKSRWRGQTYCAAAFATMDCGHVQAFV
jgi:hypothetical protein